MFRTPSMRDSILEALRKLLQGGGGKSGYIQVCNKGSRQSEQQRSGIKLRNLAFCALEDAALLPFICTLAILSHSSCFLPSPSSPAVTVGGDSIPWIPVLEAFIHIWRPGIINMAGYIFISHILFNNIAC